LFIIVLLVVIGFVLFRWWQGPLMPSYILSSMSLVQNVVATGRVATVSRAEVASEISGVVLQRLVQEGDEVKPSDLLVVLKSGELLAQVRQAELALTELASSRRTGCSRTGQLEQASREAARRRNAEAGIMSGCSTRSSGGDSSCLSNPRKSCVWKRYASLIILASPMKLRSCMALICALIATTLRHSLALPVLVKVPY
jgi:multidrug resistance efflux pump